MKFLYRFDSSVKIHKNKQHLYSWFYSNLTILIFSNFFVFYRNKLMKHPVRAIISIKNWRLNEFQSNSLNFVCFKSVLIYAMVRKTRHKRKKLVKLKITSTTKKSGKCSRSKPLTADLVQSNSIESVSKSEENVTETTKVVEQPAEFSCPVSSNWPIFPLNE